MRHSYRVTMGWYMRALFSPVRLFHHNQPLMNAAAIFFITTLFYFIGAQLRLVEELSLFWPLNAVMAGVFARYAFLNHWRYYMVSYVAMILYDGVTTSWGVASLVINFSNMVFIVTLAWLVQREQRASHAAPLPINALNLFGYCLIAALLCALCGATGSMGIVLNQDFLLLFGDWFSEQFSTGVLIVPCVLTVAWPRVAVLTLRDLLPVVALAVSVMGSVIIGGAGSLAFPLPALIWCAVRFPLPVTCLLTLVTGGVEIILVANSVINIFVASPQEMPRMFSARLGIATMAICPVIVSVSVQTINRLIQQVALRADFDFLTQVYSRSGLYEALNHDSKHFSRKHLSVMLLDVDYFKRVNDSYGHECGDSVLKTFARQVRNVVGDDGVVARMGGEEFAVVAATSGPEEGYRLAERIRATIAEHPFVWQAQTLRLTVSIGVSHGQAQPRQLTEVFNKLLAGADEFLYQAKKAGRNCIRMRAAVERSAEPVVF